MLLKQKVYQYFSGMLDEKIASLQNVLDDLKQSGANETKSTAGDKHETALAMLQIEQANKRAQLQELLQQKAVLNKIDPSLQTVQVVNGSLIATGGAYYFISAALGKTIIDEKTVIALSAQSPLGTLMMGMKKGDRIVFNRNEIIINDIQ
ncbi:MAG: hypothetical protein QM687_07495 [Ferruginibacter sp.]